MAEFVVNDAFTPHLQQAVIYALDDLREQTYQEVKRNIAPATVISSVSVVTTPARLDGSEVTAFVGYGKGLGPIYEGGTGSRFTKGPRPPKRYGGGAHRGRITTASFAMKNADESALRRGLDLSRYL